MKKHLLYLFMLLAGMGVVGSSNATVFAIDSFEVMRDGSQYFYDTFEDGDLPPTTGGWVWPAGNPAEYGTIGTPGPELRGKLLLDTADGQAKPSEVSGESLLVQRSRLITNTTNDPTNGLKMKHDIAVFGTFDLIAPELILERYGVRLTDFKTGYASNDVIDINVQRDSGGDLRVVLREADFGLGTMNVLDQVLLTDSDFINYDQIVLGLFNAPGTKEVFGGYQLTGAGGSTNFYMFGSAGNIYDGELWTRAGFIASRVVKDVPEPTSLALLGLGLVGLSFARQKQAG